MRRLARIEDRRATAYEKKYAGAILKALKAQGEDYVKTGDVGDRVGPVIEDLYLEVMPDFMERQWKALENDVRKRSRFFRQDWWAWIQLFKELKLASRVRAIDDTTRERLRFLSEKASSEGWTFDELVEEITRHTAGRIARRRALTIARTEVGEAINLAKTKSSDDWEAETGMAQGKIWIHRGAKDPRDWHLALDDGKMIPKHSYWVVTDPNTGVSDKMMHPHDPSAHAGNVINCGCQVLYKRWDENYRR